ncbi:galectin-3-like [Scleropages formosus]|uniref:galectin-3-like n=1 Tax=Scleropages formosus TaxID=113540 RepID=UPI000878AA27|nr:galectin-3-like [Scleropages formosus]
MEKKFWAQIHHILILTINSMLEESSILEVASAYNQGACSGAFAYTEKATSGALAYTKGQCYGAPGFNQDLSSEAFAYTRRTFSVDSEYNQVPPPVAPAYSQAPPPVGLTYNQASLPVAPIYNQAPLPVAPLYNQAPPPVAPMYNQAPPPVAVAYAEGTRGVAVAFVQGSSPDVPEKPKTSSSTAVACSSGPPLVTPYKLIMQGGMYHGRSITVQGVVNLSAKTFFIELRYKNGVAFQLSPDFDKSRVVCSSQKWRSEERLQGLPFCKGRPFTVNILCEVTCYRISINGIQTITFKHRYSMLNEIDILEIGGDVSLTSVEC